ncbi:Armadillo-like helical-containing protein [Synechococcus sp. PROS-9-1]|uniref:HEAT repeat domain-containing protein n=1 Tax=Synechococcus sp. PROS-9-1 TaxID=1968775 RepID=UPI001646DE79|nr:HEAT repeat domain-containing protein [Synechococcus sp. PROS-9-1]QNJ33124.1 Armadillo-like helical-containing protein [Synechococcus sp. PROS-9-1]
MSAIDEATLWDRLANARRIPLNPTWLGEIFSPSLSDELRFAVAERLGMLAETGWPIIRTLIQQHGIQPELIHAAGLCHQPEAKDWLLTQLNQSNDPDAFLLNALSCWGAELTYSDFQHILQLPSQAQRLAGLNLLSFKSHQLQANELLQLCESTLQDWRDPVVIACIRLLQRRDDIAISTRLSILVQEGSDAVAEAALRALGCMATTHSKMALKSLSVELTNQERREQAVRQLQQQY